MSLFPTFDFSKKLARRDDHSQSKDAADHIVRSKKREEHFVAIEKLLLDHPGQTCRELGQHGVLTDDQIHKRVGEMEKAGRLVRPITRKCNVTGRKAYVCYLPGQCPLKGESDGTV